MIRISAAAIAVILAAAPAAAGIAEEAKCVVSAQEREVRRLLATIPTSADDIEQSYRTLKRARSCPTEALGQRTNGRYQLAMRGALAEALIRRDHWPLPAAPRPDAASRRGLGAMTAKEVASSGAIAGAIDAHAFAGCLVREDWPGVAAVIQTRPGTRAEHDAIMAMKPRFPGCLDPTAKIGMRANFLRAAFAEETLRALDAPGTATAAR